MGSWRNRAGNFVQPSLASFQAATRGVDWEKSHDFCAILNDAPGDNAYPIVATSFVLMPRHSPDAMHTRNALAFFKWSLENGQDIANTLSYVPLPADLAYVSLCGLQPLDFIGGGLTVWHYMAT